MVSNGVFESVMFLTFARKHTRAVSEVAAPFFLQLAT